MSALFLPVRTQPSIYGFSSAEVRQSARRQLNVSSFILACFGIGCALAFAI